MPNQSGKMYGLTALCPIQNGGFENQSFATIVRQQLQSLGTNEFSPMAKVPNTYLARLFVIDNVFYEGKPAQLDQLKSKYLVFVVDFHGELDSYLEGAWSASSDDFRRIWEHCVAFDQVRDSKGFVEYIKKCQVYTTFLFNGSTDDSLPEQLKSLYLKQEFSKFAFENQGLAPKELRQAFQQFIARTEPANLAGPTWRAGAADLSRAVDSK